MGTEKSGNESELDTTFLSVKEGINQSSNCQEVTYYLSNYENKSQEHFSFDETEIISDELTSNPIKDINFEINLMNVKSLENQPGLTVSYKCLQCSDLFPTYSGLVDHVIKIHQIKPLPSPFTCEECAMRFNTDALLMQHIKKQHLAKRIQCSLCPDREDFKSLAELTRHKADIHSLKCEKCRKLFYSQEKLDRHMDWKHDDRLACNVCGKVLSSVQGRKMHELTHTDRSEMCWICGLVVKNCQVLKGHMQGHSDETYPCDICDKLFPSPLYLRRHKKTHAPNKGEKCFICHVCAKAFTRKSQLDRHLVAHSKGRILMCHFCGKGFKHKGKLILHEATREASGGICPVTKRSSNDSNKNHDTSEEEKGSLECDVCGRKFLKVYNANRHRRYHFCQGNPEVIQKLLDEPEVYKCDKCGKRFYNKHTVQRHMAAKHTGVAKPFACAFCPKKFRTRPQISIHESVHVGEKRHSCSECGKKFKTKSHLNHHKSVHTEEKTHVCPLCDAAFRSRGCLLEHTFYNHKDAESIRPFQCMFCGNRFISNSTLKAHITKNHSEDNLQENENIQAEDGGYPCSVCGKVLVSLIASKKHERRMHRNKLPIKVDQEDIETESVVTEEYSINPEDLVEIEHSVTI